MRMICDVKGPFMGGDEMEQKRVPALFPSVSSLAPPGALAAAHCHLPGPHKDSCIPEQTAMANKDKDVSKDVAPALLDQYM